jgi:hypothetical protein
MKMGACGNTSIPDITDYFTLLNTLTDIYVKAKHMRVTCVVTVFMSYNDKVAVIVSVFGSYYLAVRSSDYRIA